MSSRPTDLFPRFPSPTIYDELSWRYSSSSNALLLSPTLQFLPSSVAELVVPSFIGGMSSTVNVSTAASLKVQGSVYVQGISTRWLVGSGGSLQLQGSPAQGCFPTPEPELNPPPVALGMWTFADGATLEVESEGTLTVDGTSCLSQQQPAVLLVQGPSAQLNLQSSSTMTLQHGAALVLQGDGAVLNAHDQSTLWLQPSVAALFDNGEHLIMDVILFCPHLYHLVVER